MSDEPIFGGELADPLKKASKCPHCDGIALAVKHPTHRYVCDICGGPRIYSKVDDVVLSGDEIPHLKKAEDERGSRFRWRAAGLFGALTGSFVFLTTLIFLLLFSPGFIGAAIGFAVSLPFLLLAFTALGKSTAKSASIDREIDEAWRNAARDVVIQTGGISAERLAEVLPMSQTDAEQVAAELSVDGMLRTRFTDSGDQRFEPVGQQGTGHRTSVRIDAGADGGSKTVVTLDPLEEKFAALEEAMAAEEEAAATQVKKS